MAHLRIAQDQQFERAARTTLELIGKAAANDAESNHPKPKTIVSICPGRIKLALRARMGYLFLFLVVNQLILERHPSSDK